MTACIVEKGKDYLLEDGAVTIPAPVILKTVFQDDTHTLVYGNFWVMNYTAKDHVLACISGGEYPGIMTLEKKGEGWEAVALEIAGDGDTIVLAGKGHETYQEIMGVKRPFDEKVIVSEILLEMKTREANS